MKLSMEQVALNETCGGETEPINIKFSNGEVMYETIKSFG